MAKYASPTSLDRALAKLSTLPFGKRTETWRIDLDSTPTYTHLTLTSLPTLHVRSTLTLPSKIQVTSSHLFDLFLQACLEPLKGSVEFIKSQERKGKLVHTASLEALNESGGLWKPRTLMVGISKRKRTNDGGLRTLKVEDAKGLSGLMRKYGVGVKVMVKGVDDNCGDDGDDEEESLEEYEEDGYGSWLMDSGVDAFGETDNTPPSSPHLQRTPQAKRRALKHQQSWAAASDSEQETLLPNKRRHNNQALVEPSSSPAGVIQWTLDLMIRFLIMIPVLRMLMEVMDRIPVVKVVKKKLNLRLLPPGSDSSDSLTEKTGKVPTSSLAK
ncbi:hypothetical protein HDV05_006445 [Chytridiales sp. JEL 0842]|nr:hypothetical protein HDV05_006445 [Chytridiales sp. JEL 0842]